MQAAAAQRGHQAGVVAVALDQLRKAGQHDPRMEDVRPRELHAPA
jgi:hypothetical protein